MLGVVVKDDGGLLVLDDRPQAGQELQDAWWPDRRYITSYDFEELLPTRGFDFWQLHGEDLDLFGDGAVRILSCPADTRGEQALVVRLAKTGMAASRAISRRDSHQVRRRPSSKRYQLVQFDVVAFVR